MSKKPKVFIPCNKTVFESFPVKEDQMHFMQDQYIRPLVDTIGCTPLFIPASGTDFDFDDIEDIVDGIILPGALSNVNPDHYGGEREFHENLLDMDRDNTCFRIIKAAIDKDIPLLAICRGFQELNVFCGGSLYQKLHEMPDYRDHRTPLDKPSKERYAILQHKIFPNDGGIFADIGITDEFSVSSCHEQGIDRLGDNLLVEGVAEDGIVEAISVPGNKFILGVQWHPEGDYRVTPASLKIFEAFRAAL